MHGNGAAGAQFLAAGIGDDGFNLVRSPVEVRQGQAGFGLTRTRQRLCRLLRRNLPLQLYLAETIGAGV